MAKVNKPRIVLLNKCDVADEKAPKHDLFHVPGTKHKERCHKNKGQRKSDIPYKTEFLSRCCRCFVRKKIEDHRSPTGIPTPASAKQKWSEYFCYGIMDRCRFKHAGKEIVPEPFDLHILIGNDTEINEHIAANKELHDTSCMFHFLGIKKQTQRNR